MIINGTDGNDILGKDVLTVDTMAGKKGNDTYYVNAVGDKIIESLDQGIDTVISDITYTLSANVENLTLTGTAVISGTGNALDNTVTGNSAGNNLYGGIGGNDTLIGMDGNDFLYGRSGNNILIGGAGNDTYIDVANDDITELAGQGSDRVYSTTNYTLGANLENLVLKQGVATIGTGNTLSNQIIGNASNNVLSGLAGNDTLSGLAGNDTLDGGAGNDTLTGGDGTDVLIGGLGKDTYILTETVHSTDTVVTGLNTTFNVNNMTASTDIVKGFVLGEDKLDVSFANIAPNADYKHGIAVEGIDTGVITGHSVSNGIYTLYDASQQPVTITPENQNKAVGYMLENTNSNGSIAAFHVTNNNGQVDTIVMQHNNTQNVENHVVVDLIGVNATSLSATGGADAIWII